MTKKKKKDVIVLRPDTFVEFSVEMVACNKPLDPESARAIPTATPEDEKFESQTMDVPLIEFDDLQVLVPCSTTNGKVKAVSLSKKKPKLTRRRGA